MNELHIHINAGCACQSGKVIQLSTLEAIKPPATLEWSKTLCGGKRVPYEEAEKAVAKLGSGWRMPSPHEKFPLVNYQAKNQHGALSDDPEVLPLPYWTNQETPWSREAQFVVGFDNGYVDCDYRYDSACVRAVRVSGQ